MDIVGLIASIVGIIAGIVAAYPLYSNSHRRRRWAARRRALNQTPGATPEFCAAVKSVRSDLRPSATSGEQLERKLRHAVNGQGHEATISVFLSRLHAALVDEDFSVLWSPPRLVVESGAPPLPPAVEPVSMVGRDEELVLARNLIDMGRNFRICGPPGIGKSTLLRAIGAEHPTCAYVRLEQGGEPLSELRLALNRVSGSAYVDDDAAGIAMLAKEIADGLLLLVDNADEEASSNAVERLAGHLPQITVVVTTRGRIFDGFDTLTLPPLAQQDSLALIADVGLSEQENLEVVDSAGGNPQLTLQGAWAARDGTPLDDDDHLESVMNRVPHEERRTLLLIGELPSATLPHALLVDVGHLGNGGLTLLQRNAVLRREPVLSTIHQTLRVACQKLASATPSRERTELNRDSARFFTEWVTAGPDPKLIDATWPAINHLLERLDDDKLRIDLALALIGDALDDPHGYIPTQGLGTLLLRHFGRLEQAAQAVGGVPAGQIEKNLGLFCFWAGDPRCKALLLRAQTRFNETGDLEGRASATWLLGNIADDACDFRQADALYRAPLDWLGASPARAVGLHLVGVRLYHQGRYEEARKNFIEARDVAEDAGLLARIERRLAYIELAIGDPAAAIDKLEIARATSELLLRPRDVARIKRHIAKGLIRLERFDEATDLLQHTKEAFERLGDTGGTAATQCVMATARRHQGRLDEARELALSSVQTASGVNPPIEPMLSPLGVALGEDELGRIAIASGEPAEAEIHLRRALNIFESVGHARASDLRATLGDRRDAQYPPATTVIFDLVDTLAVIEGDAYADVKTGHSQALGVDRDVFQEAWARSRKRSSIDASWTPEDRLRWVCEQIGVTVTPDLLSELADRERDLWSRRVRLSPEAVDLLKTLRRKGFRTGILSNGSSAIAGLAESLQLSTLVDAAAVSCQLGALKPDPRAYARLLARVPAEPHECIFVGDGNDRELEGAKAAGLFAVRFRSTKPDYNSKASLDWDATITSLPELLGHLDGSPNCD